MAEHFYGRLHIKNGKSASVLSQGSHKPVLIWSSITSPTTEPTRIGQGIEIIVCGTGGGSKSATPLPPDLHWQAGEDARSMVIMYAGGISSNYYGDSWYEEYTRALMAQPQGQQPAAYGGDPLTMQRRGGLLMESKDTMGRQSGMYSPGLPSHEPCLASPAHLFMGVLPLASRREAAFDLFGHPVPTGSPAIALFTHPQPTVADQLAALLVKLQDLSKKRQEFNEKVVADINTLLDEQPTARTALLSVARGEPAPGGRPAWAPRVRWFAIEQLRHWSLPKADATEFLPAPGYLETLIEAMESWVEDEALYGAVVNVRMVKVDAAQRAKLRDALTERLTSKISSLERTMNVFEAQLLGQTLCTFSSFACSDDLELLGRFALSDSAFAVRTHALDALRKVACREPNASATDTFFDVYTDRFVELCRSCLQFRRSSETAGTLLWSAVGVLLGRFGKESSIVADLAHEHPKLRRDIALEINRAAEYLTRIGQARRLETQTVVRHQLAASVADLALTT